MNKTNKTKLDKYESALEKALRKGEYVDADNYKESKKLFEDAVKLHRELQKTKRITLRVNKKDLIKVKVKAKKSKIPYQTLISALIHQYAEENTKLTI